MTKPEDIPQWAWEKAESVFFPSATETRERAARAILSAVEEAEAERDLLQDILDSRPAINAALPESYIRWSQAIYSGDFARAAIRSRKES